MENEQANFRSRFDQIVQEIDEKSKLLGKQIFYTKNYLKKENFWLLIFF